MENDLLLLSGNDIPFYGAQVSTHQPTIKEIAYIGEEAFYRCDLEKLYNMLNDMDIYKVE